MSDASNKVLAVLDGRRGRWIGRGAVVPSVRFDPGRGSIVAEPRPRPRRLVNGPG
jgi:hypothetical protein